MTTKIRQRYRRRANSLHYSYLSLYMHLVVMINEQETKIMHTCEHLIQRISLCHRESHFVLLLHIPAAVALTESVMACKLAVLAALYLSCFLFVGSTAAKPLLCMHLR